MIPSDVVDRAVRAAAERLESEDQVRVLAEFSIKELNASELEDLVRKLNDLVVRGVRFTGVFTLIPVPREARDDVPRL